MERQGDPCTPPAYPFEHGDCGCIGVRNTAKIQFEISLIRREGGCTRVLQASHVADAQTAADREP